MKSVRETVAVHTEPGQQFLDVTKQVRDAIGRSEIRDGIALIHSIHTTLALFVNEFQTALIEDLGQLLQKLVPKRNGYVHDDPRYSDCDRGNGHAHLRSMLLGRSVALAVANRELVLGQYESVIAVELDGPRERTLGIQVIGE